MMFFRFFSCLGVGVALFRTKLTKNTKATNRIFGKRDTPMYDRKIRSYIFYSIFLKSLLRILFFILYIL
jgi:hypothetical protein